MDVRIGFGYDSHQLAENISLFLGGVQIPHAKGCVAHSDGDVLIHAVRRIARGGGIARYRLPIS